MNFEVVERPSQEQRNLIFDPIVDHSIATVGRAKLVPISVFLKDTSGELIGGANGFIQWNYLYAEHMWVRPDMRKQKLGPSILLRLEKEAQLRGCEYIWFDTYTFQTKDYYEKLGYQKFGELPNFPAGHKRVFYTKKL